MKPGITAEIRLFSLYSICLKVKGFTVIGKNVLNTSRFGLVFIDQTGLFTVSGVCYA